MWVKKRSGKAIAVLRRIKAIAVAAAIGCAGLQASANAYGDDVLRVATDLWLPYENISNEQAPGFSTEVIANVLSEMGVKGKTRELPWARALKEVFEGRSDALYSAFWSKEREQYCLYPEEPLATEKWVFFVRTTEVDRLSFSSYDELKNRQIGVLRGASITEEFWSFLKDNENFHEVPTDETNLTKLVRGRLDYVVTSYSNGIMLAKEMGLSDQIQPLPSPIIKEDDLHIIFSKKTVEPAFVGRFSTALRKFKKTNAYREIHERYFGLTTD
jgi:polar amino acid transport system substrate-binding protein